MSFHPISGLFQPGEGPGLRDEAPDVCAFVDDGRWRTVECGSTDVTSLVVGSSLPGEEPRLCTPHADRWEQTPAVQEGFHIIRPLDLPEEG